MSNTLTKATPLEKNKARQKISAKQATKLDTLFIKLAREMATNHFAVEDLMERFKLTPRQFKEITSHPRFEALLQAETEAWNAADNTKARVRLKAAGTVEEFMTEAYRLLMDSEEPLSSKVRLFESLVQLGDLNPQPADPAIAPGEGFTININIDAVNNASDIGAGGRMIDGSLTLHSGDNPQPAPEDYTGEQLDWEGWNETADLPSTNLLDIDEPPTPAAQPDLGDGYDGLDPVTEAAPYILDEPDEPVARARPDEIEQDEELRAAFAKALEPKAKSKRRRINTIEAVNDLKAAFSRNAGHEPPGRATPATRQVVSFNFTDE